ncbi:hypothetical protein [Paenibacillus sp. MMS20-IR301]|uniref:hypothetical protein n=1 Tax=Paenibacillus sp. MMS20-IR301 TaxID=2895946 RepID=UPI0028ED226B|nr:hypothetical protein [Paenibacillus sp. MMS20-IR301]WNS45143.1 hypothetical protein LOS79_07700 [Paenibacillus sp. MMS20-IR301]
MNSSFPSGPSPRLPDPDSHKANHDVNARKLHTEGITGFWRQVTDLVIAVAVIVLFVFILKWIF